MPSPTRAQVQTSWANAVDIIDQLEKFGRGNAKNFINMQQVLEQSLITDFADDVEGALQSLRGTLAGALSPASYRALQRPFLKQYCKTIIGKGNLNNDQSMLDELYKYFIDNSLRVQSRVVTFGTPAAGTNTGNGQIVRLTKDQYNFDLEATYIDAKRAICIGDYQTGTDKGAELWQFDGNTKSKDELQRSGSGAQLVLAGLTARDSFLSNASWSSFAGTAAAPTDLTNWTSSLTVNSTNYALDSTNFFRPAPGDGTTSYALQMKASGTLTQKLSLTGRKLRTDRPYLLALAWNRAVNGDSGTLNIRMGGVTTTVSVAAQTGWNVTLVPNPIGQSAWYRLFAQDDLQCQIDWARSAGSGILFDDVLLVEGALFDGCYYWILPASASANIAHRNKDTFTWTDTSADTAKIQKALWRAWGFSLPSSNGSSITFNDPT